MVQATRNIPTDIRREATVSQPGASSWLTALPIKEHGFCLHKGAKGVREIEHASFVPLVMSAMVD
jgi:hypothetical protein